MCPRAAGLYRGDRLGIAELGIAAERERDAVVGALREALVHQTVKGLHAVREVARAEAPEDVLRHHIDGDAADGLSIVVPPEVGERGGIVGRGRGEGKDKGERDDGEEGFHRKNEE